MGTGNNRGSSIIEYNLFRPILNRKKEKVWIYLQCSWNKCVEIIYIIWPVAVVCTEYRKWESIGEAVYCITD